MKKEIQKLLNIDDNFTIKDVKVQGEESIIFCEWKRRAYVCPECLVVELVSELLLRFFLLTEKKSFYVFLIKYPLGQKEK